MKTVNFFMLLSVALLISCTLPPPYQPPNEVVEESPTPTAIPTQEDDAGQSADDTVEVAESAETTQIDQAEGQEAVKVEAEPTSEPTQTATSHPTAEPTNTPENSTTETESNEIVETATPEETNEPSPTVEVVVTVPTPSEVVSEETPTEEAVSTSPLIPTNTPTALPTATDEPAGNNHSPTSTPVPPTPTVPVPTNTPDIYITSTPVPPTATIAPTATLATGEFPATSTPVP